MAAPMVKKETLLKISSLCRLWTSYGFPRNALIVRHASSTTSIKSLIYDERGDPRKVIKLEEQSLPDVGKDAVLVKMLAAPVNPADINTIQGVYPIQPALPAIAGFEGVGEIQDVGSDVMGVKPGERVIFPSSLTGTWRTNLVCPASHVMVVPKGTWRTHLVCPASHVMVVPEGTPSLVAATLKVNACTAYRMLADFEELQEGDTVIQNAANSGAGQAVIQIAAARGVKTINIVRDRPNLDQLSSYLQELGATVVTTEGSLRQEASTLLKDLSKPKLALNAVGGKSIISLVKQLQQGGTIVTYGGMSKQPVMVPTGSLIFNDLKFKGFWMSRWHEQNAGNEESRRMFLQLCNWGQSGLLRAPKHRLVAIDDYGVALETALAEYTTEKQILTF